MMTMMTMYLRSLRPYGRTYTYYENDVNRYVISPTGLSESEMKCCATVIDSYEGGFNVPPDSVSTKKTKANLNCLA